MVVTPRVQLACHVLFSSPFISSVDMSMKSYCYFSSRQQEEKKCGETRLGKAQGENYGNKSHMALWEDKKVETERQHVTYPNQIPSKDWHNIG